MKKTLSIFFILFFLTPRTQAITTSSGCEHAFLDLQGHWAEDAVCALYQNQVVQGYSEKNFAPNSTITRAEFIKIVLKGLNYNVYSIQSAAFTDTEPGDWYYSYVSFAHSKGFIDGYSDGSFHPNAPITRAEAIQILINTAGFLGAYASSEVNHMFNDVDGNDWFATAVAIGIDYELIKGYGDGSFRPHNDMTRAEASVLIEKAMTTLY